MCLLTPSLVEEFSDPMILRTIQDGESRFCFFSDRNHLLFDAAKKVTEREASQDCF